jgi:HEAT repeat protein
MCRLRTHLSAACTVLLLVIGCVRQTRRADLSALYPVDRARAVVRLAESGDFEAVHSLVELLDDQDGAVRMYSILALERICGENLGYEYYASESSRQLAIERWREALREGRVRLRSREPIGALRTPATAVLASRTGVA